jgi:nucleotide-binding universal stress UspA family protein
MDTIVVGYDQTEAADRALERAAMFSKAFGSKVIVTSVAAVLDPAPRGMGPIDPVERFISGSVSGSVGRRAHCDVLIVH